MLNSGVRSSWETLLMKRLWAALSSTSRVRSWMVTAMPLRVSPLASRTDWRTMRRVRGGSPKLRVEISDTGSGISREDQEKIFDRFYRVENAVHTEVGTGLGLSIVRGILEKHGATIRMVSELNVGTTFWFDLPLEDADETELRLQAERRNSSNLGDGI